MKDRNYTVSVSNLEEKGKNLSAMAQQLSCFSLSTPETITPLVKEREKERKCLYVCVCSEFSGPITVVVQGDYQENRLQKEVD